MSSTLRSETERYYKNVEDFIKYKNKIIKTFVKICDDIPKKKLLIIPSLLNTEYIKYKYFKTRKGLIILIIDELKNTKLDDCENLELVYSFIKQFKID